MLKLWRPDIVIINSTSVIDATNRLAPDAMLVYWPAEAGYHRADPEWLRDMLPGRFEHIDKIIVWAEGAIQPYLDIFPDAPTDKFAACGNARLDMVKFHPELANNRKNSRSIGIVGRFDMINSANGVGLLNKLVEAENFATIMMQSRLFSIIVELVRHLVETTDLTISMRPHPIEAAQGYQRLKREFGERIEIDMSMDVAYWASRQRLLVAPASTSFYEPYLLRVPIINIDVLAESADYARTLSPIGSKSHGIALQPGSMDELFALAKQELPASAASPEIDAHLREQCDWEDPRSAILRGVTAILDAVANRAQRNRLRVPLAVLEKIDDWSFRRAMLRDPYHPNMNFKSGYHPIPDYYEDIVDAIMRNG